jgi:hypothetical protein
MLGAAAVAAMFLLPGAAFAAGCGAGGAIGGATAGAVVGGPVGAVAGGVAGAAVGCAINPPSDEVKQYIIHEHHPSVTVQEEVTVGHELPPDVQVYDVPQSKTYAYAVVNNRHVVVDPHTRKVITIYDND